MGEGELKLRVEVEQKIGKSFALELELVNSNSDPLTANRYPLTANPLIPHSLFEIEHSVRLERAQCNLTLP